MASVYKLIHADGLHLLKMCCSHQMLQPWPYICGLADLINMSTELEVTVQGHGLSQALISNVPHGQGRWISTITGDHIILPLNLIGCLHLGNLQRPVERCDTCVHISRDPHYLLWWFLSTKEDLCDNPDISFWLFPFKTVRAVGLGVLDILVFACIWRRHFFPRVSWLNWFDFKGVKHWDCAWHFQNSRTLCSQINMLI